MDNDNKDIVKKIKQKKHATDIILHTEKFMLLSTYAYPGLTGLIILTIVILISSISAPPLLILFFIPAASMAISILIKSIQKSLIKIVIKNKYDSFITMISILSKIQITSYTISIAPLLFIYKILYKINFYWMHLHIYLKSTDYYIPKEFAEYFQEKYNKEIESIKYAYKNAHNLALRDYIMKEKEIDIIENLILKHQSTKAQYDHKEIRKVHQILNEISEEHTMPQEKNSDKTIGNQEIDEIIEDIYSNYLLNTSQIESVIKLEYCYYYLTHFKAISADQKMLIFLKLEEIKQEAEPLKKDNNLFTKTTDFNNDVTQTRDPENMNMFTKVTDHISGIEMRAIPKEKTETDNYNTPTNL